MAKETNDKVDRRKAPRGPRQINFVCGAVDKDGNLIHRLVAANTREEAEKKFKGSTKLAPVFAEGPLYQVKGTGAAAQRLSITVPAEEVSYSKNRWQAVLRGYKVFAQGLNAFGEYKADELVLVMPIGPVDEKSKGPRLFKATETPIVPFSALENPKQA